MVVFAATPRSTRTFQSLAAASELKWIRGDDSRRFLTRAASTPSTQVLRRVVQGRALLLRQALLFEGRRAATHMLRVVRRQGGLLPVRIMLLRARL